MLFQFGHFILDTHNSKLYSGNTIISDDERLVKTLQILCEAYPEYADKDHLIAEVWQDQVVTDWSLSKLISEIRQTLGDSGKDQGTIKTIRGKGFKLNMNVTTVDSIEQANDSNTPPERKSRTGLFISATVVLLVAAIALIYSVYKPTPEQVLTDWPRHVAVMPVENEATVVTTNDWVKYGVMSLVAEQLNSYSSLQVIPVKDVLALVPNEEQLDALSDDALFESICSSLGCTDLIQITYGVENKLPRLTYRVLRDDHRSDDYVGTDTDVIDATTLIIDHMITALLPEEVNELEIEQKLTGNSKADREFAMGLHELYNGDFKTAGNYLQLAHNREPDFFWINYYMAEVDYRVGNLSTAEQTINELDNQRLSSEQAYFLQHLYSNVLYSQGELDESLAVTRALTINDFAINNPILLGNEYLNIGSSLQATGNNTEAIKSFEKSSDLYKAAGYLSGEGKVLFNLGNVYLTNSQPQLAIESYTSAREIFTRLGMVGYALMAKHQVASTNLYLGHIQTAEGALRQLLVDYEKVGDIEGLHTAELDLANVSLAQKDYAEGLLRITTLLEKIQSTELSYLINHALVIAAKCYLMTGDPASAAASYSEVNGDWFDIRPGFALIPAHILHDQGDLAGALTVANEIKDKLGEQWTAAHQEIFDMIKRSVDTGEAQQLLY